MFIRKTASKLKLDDDAKRMLGALLVYMRNEFRVGVSAAEYHPPDVQSEAVWGAATNYKRMMQCIDRCLARLDGTWDATKLALAYEMIESAMQKSGGKQLSRHLTNSIENVYGSLAPDSEWNRIAGTGDAELPGVAGTGPAIPGDGNRGGSTDDSEHVDDGPRRYLVDTSGSDGTTASDSHCRQDNERADSGQPD